MIRKFYDTNALLTLQGDAFLDEQGFYISTETLRELENIKTSRFKDEKVKHDARVVARLLKDNPDKYTAFSLSKGDYADLEDLTGGHFTPDDIIVHTAHLQQQCEGNIQFITDDICCFNWAKIYDDMEVVCLNDYEGDDYSGYVEVEMNELEMAYFYEHLGENIYQLLINQYIVVKNSLGEEVDCYRWDGNIHQPLYKKPIKSIYFEKLKAKDIYQKMAIDSIMNNTITALTGKAGSGKSLISLMTIMNLIESGKYDRFVSLFNAQKSRYAADLGYYGGDFLEKAMQNSIGHILTTKFGDRFAIDMLLSQNKIKLVSMADCRGMEIGDNEILWITEASNTSIDLMKLCLSRVSSGAKVIIEGDPIFQVDSKVFEGRNNGLRRAIEVFKGHEEFGHVTLPNVWRSKIAELCELL